MLEAFDYPFFQRAFAAGLLASLACGVMGSYVVVKRMASVSGGLSHAAFGGVGLGYLLGFDPLLGATGFALLSGVGVRIAHNRVHESLDTVIAILWSTGMALGILFMSLRSGYAPDLMSYLFGSIMFVSRGDIMFVAGLDLLILLSVVLLFHEFRAITFDEEYSVVAGIPVELLSHILLGLVSLAVVVLIQVVGVILVIALLTIPAAVARQWTDSLLSMMGLATGIGVVCTTCGLFLSYGLSASFDAHVPTGPLIILLAAACYLATTAAKAAIKT